MNDQPIVLQTCEASAAAVQRRALAPREGEPWSLFRIDDPFGLRRAVVPIFAAGGDGELFGMGAAFSLDPWGAFVTADHVVDFARATGNSTRDANGETVAFNSETNIVALLGIGLVFGTVGIPPDAVARVVRTWTPGIRIESPLAFTAGGVETRAWDLSLLAMAEPPPRDLISNLPIRLGSPGPRPGDLVAAVGFPEITATRGRAEDLSQTIAEGMFAAYGRVTALHQQGRDRMNPTPVFEVQANWPSGMSGGPVFNQAGEVIGLVSRSIAPAEGETLGTAWAIWFEAIPQLATWAPSLDPANPCARQGWAAKRSAPWSLAYFGPDRAEAGAVAAAQGATFEVAWGSSRIGTDDFMSSVTRRGNAGDGNDETP